MSPLHHPSPSQRLSPLVVGARHAYHTTAISWRIREERWRQERWPKALLQSTTIHWSHVLLSKKYHTIPHLTQSPTPVNASINSGRERLANLHLKTQFKKEINTLLTLSTFSSDLLKPLTMAVSFGQTQANQATSSPFPCSKLNLSKQLISKIAGCNNLLWACYAYHTMVIS